MPKPNFNPTQNKQGTPNKLEALLLLEKTQQERLAAIALRKKELALKVAEGMKEKGWKKVGPNTEKLLTEYESVGPKEALLREFTNFVTVEIDEREAKIALLEKQLSEMKEGKSTTVNEQIIVEEPKNEIVNDDNKEKVFVVTTQEKKEGDNKVVVGKVEEVNPEMEKLLAGLTFEDIVKIGNESEAWVQSHNESDPRIKEAKIAQERDHGRNIYAYYTGKISAKELSDMSGFIRGEATAKKWADDQVKKWEFKFEELEPKNPNHVVLNDAGAVDLDENLGDKVSKESAAEKLPLTITGENNSENKAYIEKLKTEYGPVLDEMQKFREEKVLKEEIEFEEKWSEIQKVKEENRDATWKKKDDFYYFSMKATEYFLSYTNWDCVELSERIDFKTEDILKWETLGNLGSTTKNLYSKYFGIKENSYREIETYKESPYPFFGGAVRYTANGFRLIFQNEKALEQAAGSLKKIDVTSDAAKYRIVGPDGELVSEEIFSYTTGTEKMLKVANDYQEKIIKNFEASNQKLENKESIKAVIEAFEDRKREYLEKTDELKKTFEGEK